jgi:hypothetical protein
LRAFVISLVARDIVPTMIRTIVQLRDTQAVALERVARRRGVSKAAVIRDALDELLAREGRDAALDRALRAAGSGASGVSDLGERHDDYLADGRGE